MLITVISLLCQGIFYVLLTYQVKSMLEGYHADQSFSALLRQHDGLAIGFEGRRLNVLLHVHRIYFVLLYKAGL